MTSSRVAALRAVEVGEVSKHRESAVPGGFEGHGMTSISNGEALPDKRAG